jgi:hypothetical protein
MADAARYTVEAPRRGRQKRFKRSDQISHNSKEEALPVH